jgi:hypothetical protein
MPLAARKFVLATHLTVSVGWIGALLAYLGLGVAAASSDDTQTMLAAWIAMEITGWYVIVPLAVASLITGVVIALGTRWGLFRHYWVIFSLALTSFAVAVLVFHMPTVSSNAEVARDADRAHLESLGGDLAHPSIGLVVLLGILVLNLYKPRGRTRYGRRKLDEQRRSTGRLRSAEPAVLAE